MGREFFVPARTPIAVKLLTVITSVHTVMCIIIDGHPFVRCVFVSRQFSTNKVANKNRLFRNPKGTLYSRHCLFKLRN
jgi:hypothetical protein